MVVNPEFVTSVGYDFTYAKEFERVSQTHAQDVVEFLTKLGLGNSDWMNLDIQDKTMVLAEKIDPDHPHVRRMLHALAWVSFEKNRPSRGERKLTTVRHPEYAGWCGPVMGKRTVKTGWCYPATGGQDYFGEYYFEPGGLENSKTHVILTVNLGYREFDIESHNVEKIMGDHNAGVRNRPQQGT